MNRPRKGWKPLNEKKLGTVEARFADIVWKAQPLSSGELVKLCEKELGWKKSTTYTVLKKFCERGVFQNQNGMVSAQVSRQEFYAKQCEKFVEEAFGGSLPAFIAAFTQRQALSAEEISEIRRMIDHAQEV